MYWPKHQPQLGRGSSTEAVDCGVRAIQTGIDDVTLGKFVPGVKRIRTVMNDWDETNYGDWDRAIDRLVADFEVRADKTNDWQEVVQHLKRGGGVVLAVDYGRLRKLAPRKAGSMTFSGGHALFLKGIKGEGPRKTRSYDSLNDGRYRGCPNGPVWLPLWKLREASQALSAWNNVFAILIIRPADIESGYEPSLPVEEPQTLPGILADLRDGYARDDWGEVVDAIADLESLIGVTSNEEDTAVVEDSLGSLG